MARAVSTLIFMSAPSAAWASASLAAIAFSSTFSARRRERRSIFAIFRSVDFRSRSRRAVSTAFWISAC